MATLPSADEPWRLALPPLDTERLVARLVATFHELAQQRPGIFAFSERERDLTVRLGNRLENTRASYSEMGRWDVEVHQNTYAESDSRRLDIRYVRDIGDSAQIMLVFECKKVDGSARHLRAYIDHGMRRFVTGSYAPREPLGFMVAFCTAGNTGHVASALKRSLARADPALGLTANVHGQHWNAPPLHFASYASFSTLHQRIAADASPEIVLYHVQLGFT